MTNAHDLDDQHLGFDGVDDTVISCSCPVSKLRPFQLYTSRWKGISSEATDHINHTWYDIAWQTFSSLAAEGFHSIR